MTLAPIPMVATESGSVADAPEGSIPIALYTEPGQVNEIVAALIAAGFGTSGQVLSTNATADGFTWVTPQ